MNSSSVRVKDLKGATDPSWWLPVASRSATGRPVRPSLGPMSAAIGPEVEHRGARTLTWSRMKVHWDDAKAASNKKKHGIAFEDAIAALRDPYRLEDIDDRFEYSEERMLVIGAAKPGVLLVVTAQPLPDEYRIISARKATRNERDRYNQRDDPAW